MNEKITQVINFLKGKTELKLTLDEANAVISILTEANKPLDIKKAEIPIKKQKNP